MLRKRVGKIASNTILGPHGWTSWSSGSWIASYASRSGAVLRTFGYATCSTATFLAWCASCTWLFNEYCYDWVSASGPSMYPTLPAETKFLIISKKHRLGRDMRVGDLVHYKHPNFKHLRAGKRILGMPGDIVVRDPPMSPTVGGMDNNNSSSSSSSNQEPTMIHVPPGHIWVAGDNISWSRDSRFYGPVPMALILGKIIYHSNPNSDWIIDMVSCDHDQLVPVSDGDGDGDDGDGSN